MSVKYNKTAFQGKSYKSKFEQGQMKYAQAVKQVGQVKFTPVDKETLNRSWAIKKLSNKLVVSTIDYKLRGGKTRYDIKVSKSNPKNNGKYEWFRQSREYLEGKESTFFDLR